MVVTVKLTNGSDKIVSVDASCLRPNEHLVVGAFYYLLSYKSGCELLSVEETTLEKLSQFANPQT